jgi:hypothetical protein
LFFFLRQRIRGIVNPQLLEALVDVNYTLCGVDSVKRADRAFPHGIGADFLADISPLIDDFAALHDHHCGRVNRVRAFLRSCKFLLGLSGSFKRRDLLPGLPRKTVLRLGMGWC